MIDFMKFALCFEPSCDHQTPAMQPERRLSTLEQRFVAEFIIDHDEQAAAARAGYRGDPANVGIVFTRKHYIRRAIQKAIDKLAERSLVEAKFVLDQWIDVATADVSKIVRIWKQSCRYCYGVGFKYQWRDHEEWAEAVERAVKAHEEACAAAAGRQGASMPVLMLPSADGGFGFDPKHVPHDDCPRCHGLGVDKVVLTDTALLPSREAKLIKSIKQGRNGEIEIQFRDQDKAVELIARNLGMLNDKLNVNMNVNGSIGLYKPEDLKGLSDEELEYVERVAEKIETTKQLTYDRPVDQSPVPVGNQG